MNILLIINSLLITNMSANQDQLRSRLIKQYEEHNKLIVRISAVTDDILLEQLREEYQMMESYIMENEKEYLHALFKSMTNIHKKNYSSQFIEESDIIDVLAITNEKINLYQIIDKHRMRRPKTIKDRRLLLQLTQILKCNIIIKDLESYIIDILGKNEPSDKDLIVYINHFSRFDNIDKYDNNIMTVIPIRCSPPFL
jgi:hypothetical protein